MDILVMSKHEIERKYLLIYIPTAIISIRSSDDKKLPKITYTDFIKDILFLQFDDLEATDPYTTYMKDKDAEQVKCFVERVKSQVQQIVVHCDAGVSRSAGVAAAIGKYLNGDDMFIFGRPRYAPNMTCYRKTLNALMGVETKVDKDLFDFNSEIAMVSMDITTPEEYYELFFKDREEFDSWIHQKIKEGCCL